MDFLNITKQSNTTIMPSPTPRKKNPKVSTTENVPIKSKWEQAVQGRVPYHKEGQKGTFYKKAA